jgi:hypothetical protein
MKDRTGTEELCLDDEPRPVIVLPPFERPRRSPSPDKRRAFPSDWWWY